MFNNDLHFGEFVACIECEFQVSGILMNSFLSEYLTWIPTKELVPKSLAK